MNYLAHAYLSFGIPEIAVGNLISDFIKGKKKMDYPIPIQKGIALHRAIDTFTDTHEQTRRAKSYFRQRYRLYSGPLVDIVYDHFLANDPLIFPPTPETSRKPGEGGASEGGAAGSLESFAQQTYTQVAGWAALFPEPFARIFPYMRSQNWLYNYRFRQGIYNSFAGLSRRAAYMGESEVAGRLFDEFYTELEFCYRDFFPALKDFAFSTLQQLQEKEE